METAMTCDECQDLIAGYVDEQLTADEKQHVDQHLSSCISCTQELADAQRFQQEFTAHRPLLAMPTAVEHHIKTALSHESPQPQSYWQRLHEWFSSFTRPAVAVTATAAVALIFVLVSLLLPLVDEQSLLATVTEQYEIAVADRRTFTYVIRDPHKLEQAFNNSGQLNFTTHVLDFRPAGYRIRGANIIQMNGRPTTVTVYRSVDGDLVCLRQRGPLPPLPPGAERLGRDYIYSYQQHTIIFVEEHDLFCVLISGLPREQFLRTFR